MRVANASEGFIDYRLNILGIRVWRNRCQLIAENGKGWIPLGPRWDLPIQVPRNAEELKAVGLDALRLTAYQYGLQVPGSDLVEVLGGKKDFASAVTEAAAVFPTPE